MTPLSGRAIVLVALSVLLLMGGTVVMLWWWAGGVATPDLVTARLDALKIGLSIGVGGGGVFALYLGWRRQRSTELTLTHTETDAIERRITELYTKAVEQLGSDKASVRLGGLYALERLAQNYADQRQTIAKVLCAYLRMPSLVVDGDEVREYEVRRTAQRILADHLRPGATYWSGIDLDLSGAVLGDADFRGCLFNEADFFGVRFRNPAHFDRAEFTGLAEFDCTVFEDDAIFVGVRFRGDARFDTVEFTVIDFKGAQFERSLSLEMERELRTQAAERAAFDRQDYGEDVLFPDQLTEAFESERIHL